MPNWCSTSITINNGVQEELIRFSQLLEEWTSKDYKKNSFGLKWLGNIVGNSSIGTIDKNLDTDLNCRGCLNYFELNDGQLILSTETAWEPMLRMWQCLLEKYLPDAELTFIAKECGNGLFATNDPELKNCYVIDPCGIENVEYESEASEERVVTLLQGLLKTEETFLPMLLRMLRDSDFSDELSIHKWKESSISEWP